MRIGVVGVPGGWSSEKLADSVEKQTGFRLLIDIGKVICDLRDKTVLYDEMNLLELDALIIKKVGPHYSPDMLNRLEVLKFLEDKGLPLFSKASSILQSFNRLNCTLNLKRHNIPMPDTIITEDLETAYTYVDKFEKTIFKPLFSTKARGMVVVEKDDADVVEKVTGFKNSGNSCMYIQKMVDIPGKDLGVAFLGGEYLSTYARVGSSCSWNTTIHSGGKYEPCEPSVEIIDLAYKAQKIFNLDFTSVDVVQTSDGPMVFEVSAFGGFRGLLEAQKIDVSELYVKYVMSKIGGRHA